MLLLYLTIYSIVSVPCVRLAWTGCCANNPTAIAENATPVPAFALSLWAQASGPGSAWGPVRGTASLLSFRATPVWPSWRPA